MLHLDFSIAQRLMDFDFATRINGDNLFTDPLIIEDMINIAKTNKWKFITNVPRRTYPAGVSVEILKYLQWRK